MCPGVATSRGQDNLALSKGLVEAMDGSLTAESVEGQGTTFTVELPERSHRLLSGSPSRP